MLVPSLAAAADNALTIVAPAAPGGGWDQTARAMQRVLLAAEPGATIQVDNVPGAAGTIGLARFIQSERGNPHALLITGLVMVSGIVTNSSPVSLANTTPIARLTGEYEVIAVPAASPYRSLADLIDAFKANPGAIAWGGGSAGGTDDLLVRLLAEQVGVMPARVNYVAFAGGGAALAAVLGGQLSAAVSGYAEFAGQIEAGQLRVLAVSAAQRVNGIDAPTLRESGVALDLANWRAVVAPPGLSDQETRQLADRLGRMHLSDAWRRVLTQNGWDDLFLTGPEFRQFLLSEHARIESVLRRLSASSTASTSRVTLTPLTLPTIVLGLLVLTFAGVALRHPPAAWDFHRRAMVSMALGLVLLPLAFNTLGFIVSATTLFVTTASAFRAERRHSVAFDALVGLVLATILFVVFTIGLGVSLPSPTFLTCVNC